MNAAVLAAAANNGHAFSRESEIDTPFRRHCRAFAFSLEGLGMRENLLADAYTHSQLGTTRAQRERER
jgi:hypothetical protein